MRYDLTRLPILKLLLRSRWPQFIVTAMALAGFLFAVFAGLTGTWVGNRNFGIVFVWIGWWALLMLMAVPLFGRGWCSICPIPVPGEWLQRGAILKPAGHRWGLGLRWPNKLRGIWLQNITFALVALFSAVVLTQPRITAVLLTAFLFVAVGASMIFERRAFCRYLCPVGGFIGLYSQLAPIEVRVKDIDMCAAHTEKTCYTGSADGYGCPWQVFPGSLAKNTYCGTCLECLRTCPQDNVAVNLRPFGADLIQPSGQKLDETFKGLIMLGSAIVYSAVLLGPWGALKSAAYNVGSGAWFAYAAAFLVFILAVLPGTFLLAASWGRRTASKKATTSFARALIPLGLAAWIAFSLSFVFANASYLWPVLSDPMGWGWNLFGTASAAWSPYFMPLVPALQAVILVGGLIWAITTANRVAGELSDGRRARSLPVSAFCAVTTVVLLALLL